MQGDTQAFIIRIWHEAVDDEAKIVVWRGSIEQVGNNRRLYFQDWKDLICFLQTQTGIGAREPSPWKSWLARIRHGAT